VAHDGRIYIADWGNRRIRVLTPVITNAAGPAITAVVNAGSFQSVIGPGAWVAIFGINLAQSTRLWRTNEIVGGVLPVQLDGVSVTIDGKQAAICYISPGQLNVQVPADENDGASVPVEVTTPQGKVSTTVILRRTAPGLFMADTKYVAAQHGDYSAVSAANPAKPGETIILYGTGLGPANPVAPTGQMLTQFPQLAGSATAVIGGKAAVVAWAGMGAAGLWQLNVTVPPDAPNGDALVVATLSGFSSQANAYIAIQK
jgi:uncharacterized protein (TIGR03437 family)